MYRLKPIYLKTWLRIDSKRTKYKTRKVIDVISEEPRTTLRNTYCHPITYHSKQESNGISEEASGSYTRVLERKSGCSRSCMETKNSRLEWLEDWKRTLTHGTVRVVDFIHIYLCICVYVHMCECVCTCVCVCFYLCMIFQKINSLVFSFLVCKDLGPPPLLVSSPLNPSRLARPSASHAHPPRKSSALFRGRCIA